MSDMGYTKYSRAKENSAYAECKDILEKYGIFTDPYDQECDECLGRDDCRVGW